MYFPRLFIIKKDLFIKLLILIELNLRDQSININNKLNEIAM